MFKNKSYYDNVAVKQLRLHSRRFDVITPNMEYKYVFSPLNVGLAPLLFNPGILAALNNKYGTTRYIATFNDYVTLRDKSTLKKIYGITEDISNIDDIINNINDNEINKPKKEEIDQMMIPTIHNINYT